MSGNLGDYLKILFAVKMFIRCMNIFITKKGK
jgi:hypothetical protein